MTKEKSWLDAANEVERAVAEALPRSLCKEGPRLLEIREVLWEDTLLSVSHFSRPLEVRLGEDKGTDYFIPMERLPYNGFPLLSRQGGAQRVRFLPDWEGSIHDGDRELDFKRLAKSGEATEEEDGGFSVVFQPEWSVLVCLGETKLFMRFVAKEKIKRPPLHDRLNYSMIGLWSLLICSYAVFLFWVAATPGPSIVDMFDSPSRAVSRTMWFHELDRPDPPEPERLRRLRVPERRAAIREEGKVGERVSRVDKARGSARSRAERRSWPNSRSWPTARRRSTSQPTWTGKGRRSPGTSSRP